MRGQTVILAGDAQRQLAHRLIGAAPRGAVVNVQEATRSKDQNDKMWAMLSDISRAKPDGRMHVPEVWKSLFMHALGYEVRFVMGLDGDPFPDGFKTRRLKKGQMSELIEFIYEYGDRHEVQWSEPNPYEQT